MIRNIIPAKAQFQINEMLTFEVDADPEFCAADTIKIQVFRMGRLCFEKEKAIAARLRFQYLPPRAPGNMEGFWVCAAQRHGDAVVSRKATACDRAASWSCAPRYGFLSDFGREELRDDRDVRRMNQYHLNVIQFYDWMYRHHDYFPPQSDFRDVMGKESSMDTVKEKIGQLHRYGMKAFAYGAVYGAEEEYDGAEPTCALRDNQKRVMRLIDRIIYMDIHRGTQWHEDIIAQYRKAMAFGFDGIHMDQYGGPKEAYAIENGKYVLRNLRDDFPVLIDDVKEALGESGVIFNAVNNWPVDTAAKSREDCVYIEVWPPNDTYADLNRLISDAKKYAPEKQVILAAYLLPFAKCEQPETMLCTALLAMATIFSSGGFHLLLGEENGMLTQAYYSDYCRVQNADFIGCLQNYYDFITAYEELLFGFDLVDDTRAYTGGINEEYCFFGAEFSTVPQSGCVWTQVKQTGAYKIVQLVNFCGVETMVWNSAHGKLPDVQHGIRVNALVVEEIEEIYLASPDIGDGASQKLEFAVTVRADGQKVVDFAVPELRVWDMIYMKTRVNEDSEENGN